MGFFGGTLGGIGAQSSLLSEAKREQEAERSRRFNEQLQQSYLNLAQKREAAEEVWRNKWATRSATGGRPSPTDVEATGRYIYGPNWDSMPEAQKVAYRERMYKLISPAYIRQGPEQMEDTASGYGMVTRDPLTGSPIWSNPEAIQPGLTPKFSQGFRVVQDATGTFLVPTTEERNIPLIPGQAAPKPPAPEGWTPSLRPRTPGGAPVSATPTPAPPSAPPQTGKPIAVGGRGAPPQIGTPVRVAGPKPGPSTKPRLKPSELESAARNISAGRTKMSDYDQPDRNLVANKMKELGLAMPLTPAEKKAQGPQKLPPAAISGLRVLEVSLIGDPHSKDPDQQRGLWQYMHVLDEPFYRKSLITTALTEPAGEGITGAVGGVAQTGVTSMLTEEERGFVDRLRRLIGDITSLRNVTGMPRSSRDLINRYIAELPTPRTTKDSKEGFSKVKLILQQIEAARNPAPEAGPPAPGTKGDIPAPSVPSLHPITPQDFKPPRYAPNPEKEKPSAFPTKRPLSQQVPKLKAGEELPI